MIPVFDDRTFSAVLRAGDSKRFSINLKANRDAVIAAAIAEANTGIGGFGPIFNSKAKRRDCKSIKNYSQILILRCLASYVARRFRVATPNRERMVKAVIEALSDSSPMYILRRDIKSFYECVDAAAIERRLLNEAFLPYPIKKQLERFFGTFTPGPNSGLPRGVSPSAMLAELYMEPFDKTIRRLPNVYRYFRYSDDILIFCTQNPGAVEAQLELLLPPSMKFNKNKSTAIAVACAAKEDQKTVAFEFLGYQYKFLDQAGSKAPREVQVCVSERKIGKIKTKIICALKRYKKSGDFVLLQDRLKYLAGNYSVMRKGVTSIKTSRFVKSGIFYNYRLCGTYKGHAYGEHAGAELKSLDGFYYSLLKSGAFSLDPVQRTALKEISFYKGFSLKFTHRFDPSRVQQIKEVWRNV